MEGTNITTTQLKPYYDKVHTAADGIVRYFIFGYFFFGLAISFFYDSYILAVIMGGTSVGIYYLAHSLGKGRLWFRIVVSFLFWHFPLQFLIQMHGMYEMHFFYFVSLTVLLFYQDWRVLLPAIGYAILTTIFFYYIQFAGGTSTLFEAGASIVSFENAFLHLIVFIGYAAICLLWANLQKNQTREAAIENLSMNKQLDLMETNINFANSISHGNLNAEYPAEQADKLGESLMNMRDSLVEAAERESKEKFVNVGLATIGDILRNHSDNLSALCDQVIEKLVKYMKANQGGIFIIQTDDSTDEEYLQLMACRAYERKKFMEKRLDMGQGLVGQAALERKSIFLTEVPDSYINITSGLGIANPSSLLIVPLKSNEEIVGVIEMASFDTFDESDVDFLEKVGETIASTVISAQTNQQTKELLEQSRQMTEEMQAQEEEMRQNMEEMQATQEEMGRAQKELTEKEANLNALINNTTDSIITIDNNYVVKVMNEVVKNRYKGTEYEDIREGANALDMLGDVRDEWKGYYDKALAGESLNFTIQSSVEGENYWREYHIHPIRQKTGEITGASIFSRDVTQRVAASLDLAYEKSLFSSLMDNVPDQIYFKDKDSKFIRVSKSMVRLFGKKGADEILGKSDFDFFSEEHAQPAYNDEMKIIETGTPIIGIVEKEVMKDGSVNWVETSKMPLLNEEGETIGTFGISKDVTEGKQAIEQVAQLTKEIEELKNKLNK